MIQNTETTGVTPPVVSLDLSSLIYGDTAVLGPMALQIAPRQTVALVGPSGIGKSSLLRIFGGLETGFQGHCTTHGRAVMVFQEPTLLPWRTLVQNIMVTTGVSHDVACAALADVGLGPRGQDFPGQLSLGQQRRLSLARAFAARPDLLLLDEPFVSLDPDLVDEMMQLLLRLQKSHRVTTILVTHVRAEAEKLADRIITLGGAPAQILSDAPNRAAMTA